MNNQIQWDEGEVEQTRERAKAEAILLKHLGETGLLVSAFRVSHETTPTYDMMMTLRRLYAVLPEEGRN